ncbi:hypothetical protein SLEP1_g41340 [Rubroshorea leprosula]|uniref:Uncharacterized protein n=1 Tax=Rubroshorea leprosula TaxID=152421 RepID=A0AAV5L680_9ROSI|nr:hypothetical protein SLEP1_g41340 [Rubroshorea leprosula]
MKNPVHTGYTGRYEMELTTLHCSLRLETSCAKGPCKS